jgi:hypothetical protein
MDTPITRLSTDNPKTFFFLIHILPYLLDYRLGPVSLF